ncbi:ABC transporter ATP-binding protein [Ruminococcus sp.]|uniref:ABC transporter ATP-binding protein n=1 Tax=Ruminococcus sp. TaxID=41978 RepID=UPI00261D9FD1|nr:ABC transporter ATP-binding protein [Ruminococcus sp.]MDD6988018.1 ABC transporter ATP-binding protein [Ruminococcus sp.]MDY6202714.1 ABC transporter ATP-binding protein [Ruminococcus sp.]
MIKTLAKHIKGFVKESILTPLFMILEVVAEMLIPLIMSSMIDDGINKGDMQHIITTGLLMGACALIGLFGGVMGGIYGAKASAGFARNLRMAMFENIQSYSFANIDKFSTAGLVTRLTTDVTNVQNAYQMILRMCFRAPFSLIIAMTMTFIINGKLASIYLIAIVFLSVVLGFLLKFTYKYFNQVFEKYDELNASVQENVSAIRVVKSFVREDHEVKKFNRAANNLYKLFVKAENAMVTVSPLMMLTVYACIIAISWFGANMIVGSELTTGELTSMLTYCMNILMSLLMVAMVFVMITMSLASAKRISEVLNEESTLKNPENPDYNIENGSIDFENVSFSYNTSSEKPILNNINVSIKSGETIGIIGGTGSSKTSLVNLIGRLYDVTDGVVKVGGKDVRSYDLEKLRDEVSVVLQSNVLFSGTILDNLRWGNENATEEECINACKLACADDFIQSFPDKYNTYIEQGGTNVSGGQKQRLCIARALLKKPKILILDDSTSAVDTATDARIRKAFSEEIPDTTKIIISQRISSVENADKIIVMDDGEISAVGTHEELVNSSPIYSEIFSAQTGGSGDFDKKGEL